MQTLEHQPREALPPKPDAICPGCGQAFDYQPSSFAKQKHESAFGIPLSKLSVNWASRLFWDRVDHPGCRTAIEAQEAAERARQAEEERLDRLERLREGRRERVDHWYAASDLPVDAREKTFDRLVVDDSNREALQVIKNWRATDDFGLLLIGPAGTGKSHFGFALMERILSEYLARDPSPTPADEDFIIERNALPVYASASDMLSRIRSEGNFEIPDRVMNAPVLFLDDIGAENITDWSREIFFRLFEHRLNRKRPVIATTNLTLNELKERMHERVISRVLGLCIPVQLNGRDHRRDQMAARLQSLRSRSP